MNRVLLNTGTSGEEEKQKLLLQELGKENGSLKTFFFTNYKKNGITYVKQISNTSFLTTGKVM